MIPDLRLISWPIASIRRAGDLVLPDLPRITDPGGESMRTVHATYRRHRFYRHVPLRAREDIVGEAQEFCRDIDAALRLGMFSPAYPRDGWALYHLGELPHLITANDQGDGAVVVRAFDESPPLPCVTLRAFVMVAR